MKKLILFMLLINITINSYATPNMAKKDCTTKDYHEQHTLSPHEKYKKMDSNNSKNVNKNEFTTAYPSMNDMVFEVIDQDKNGGISLDEWLAFQAKHMQGMKENTTKTKNDKDLLIMPPKERNE